MQDVSKVEGIWILSALVEGLLSIFICLVGMLIVKEVLRRLFDQILKAEPPSKQRKIISTSMIRVRNIGTIINTLLQIVSLWKAGIVSRNLFKAVQVKGNDYKLILQHIEVERSTTEAVCAVSAFLVCSTNVVAVWLKSPDGASSRENIFRYLCLSAATSALFYQFVKLPAVQSELMVENSIENTKPWHESRKLMLCHQIHHTHLILVFIWLFHSALVTLEDAIVENPVQLKESEIYNGTSSANASFKQQTRSVENNLNGNHQQIKEKICFGIRSAQNNLAKGSSDARLIPKATAVDFLPIVAIIAACVVLRQKMV